MLPRKAALPTRTRDHEEFLAAWLGHDFAEQVGTRMILMDVTRSELAKRLGVTRSWVTKFFKGENVTLRTAARLSNALGLVVAIRLVPKEKLP